MSIKKKTWSSGLYWPLGDYIGPNTTQLLAKEGFEVTEDSLTVKIQGREESQPALIHMYKMFVNYWFVFKKMPVKSITASVRNKFSKDLKFNYTRVSKPWLR